RLHVAHGATRFTAQGQLLVSDSGKDTVRVVDAATGKVILEVPGHEAVVTTDGKRLATSANDGRVRVFDIDTGKVIQSWVPPQEKDDSKSLYPVVRGFGADGQSLILQGEIVSTWAVATGKQKTSWGLLRNQVLVKPPKDEVNTPKGKKFKSK